MKVGNVSQTVLKRSVLKQLHTKRKEILTHSAENTSENTVPAMAVVDT